jgi:hypothetical protein
MKVRGLDDPPDVYQEEKTTIRKGCIVRTTIWKDTMGNELEKVGSNPSRFIITKPYYQTAMIGGGGAMFPEPATKTLEIQFTPKGPFLGGNGDEGDLEVSEVVTELVLLTCFLMLMFLSFFLGYLVATMRVRHTTKQKETENDQELELIRTYVE